MKIIDKEIRADKGKWIARKSHCKYMEDYFTISTILPTETLEDFIEVDIRPSEQVRLLDEAKEEKVKELEEYNMSDAVNTFSIMGQPQGWLDCNERGVSRNTCNALKRKGITEIPFGGMPVTIEFALNCLDELDIYAMMTMAATKTHKANIEALHTIPQVNAYDFKQGYPEIPNFMIE